MKRPDEKNIKYLFPISLMLIVFEMFSLASFGLSLYFIAEGILAALMVLALLFSDRFSDNERFKGHNYHLILLLWFISLCTVSIFGASYQGDSYRAVLQFAQLLILSLVVSSFLIKFWDSNDWPLIGMAALIVSAIAALSIITDLLGLTSFYRLFGKELSEWYARPFGIFGEANFAAGKLGILLPINVYMLSIYSERRNYRNAVCASIVIIIVMLAILITGSRLGLLEMILTISAYAVKALFSKFKERRKAKLIFAVLVPFFVIVFIFASSQVAKTIGFENTILRYRSLRDYTLGEEVDELSITGRMDLLKYTVEEIRKNPVTGVGIGNLKYYMGQQEGLEVFYSHNTFLSITAETGIFGGLLFILLFIYMFINVIKARSLLGDFFFPFIISLIAMIMMLLLLSDENNKLLWGFFLPISMYLEFMRQKRRKGQNR